MREGCFAGIMKTIEECWKEAWTFPTIEPPEDAKLIDVKNVNGDIKRLYATPDGKYWFDTERMKKFALEMEEARKRHAKKRR